MNALNELDRLAVMAYVDGELPPADVPAFDARLVREPALAAAVARERALRASLQSAYAPVLDEPVPAGLRDLLAMPEPEAANEPLPAGTNDAARAQLPHARRWRWPTWGAMAASLALGILFGTRLAAPGAPPAGDAVALNVRADGTLVAGGALRDALNQYPSGVVPDTNARAAIGLTFRNHAHEYCRTFTLDNASSGIACRQPAGWVVADLEHAPAAAASATAGGYRTAASPYSPTLLQAVDALREGDTLDAAAEGAARHGGWKP